MEVRYDHSSDESSDESSDVRTYQHDKFRAFFNCPGARDLTREIITTHNHVANQETGCIYLKYQDTKGTYGDTSVRLYAGDKAFVKYKDQETQGQVELKFSASQVNVLTFRGEQGLAMLSQAGYRVCRLCKDSACFKPEHLVIEPYTVQKSRWSCRAGAACKHFPKCIKIKTGKKQGDAAAVM